jgi:hypothetical protein
MLIVAYKKLKSSMGLIWRLDLTVKALQGIIPYYSVNPREQRILFVVIG